MIAGDWIKIEHALPSKPEVMQLADILGVDEMTVVGHLVCFWCWCDQNLSRQCPDGIGTKRGLDRVAGRDGFVDAMVTVGWLELSNCGGVVVPNYDHHLSKSAKTRANETRKKQRQRQSRDICPDGAGTFEGTTPGRNGGLEKRREEKSNSHTHTPAEEKPKEGGKAEGFAEEWARWLSFREATDGRPMPEVQADAVLMELHRRGVAKAKADIDFSLRIGARSIRDSDADFDKQRTAGGSASAAPKKRSPSKEELGF